MWHALIHKLPRTAIARGLAMQDADIEHEKADRRRHEQQPRREAIVQDSHVTLPGRAMPPSDAPAAGTAA